MADKFIVAFFVVVWIGILWRLLSDRDSSAFKGDAKVSVYVFSGNEKRAVAFECTEIVEFENSVEFLNEHGLKRVISGVGYMLEEEPKQ